MHRITTAAILMPPTAQQFSWRTVDWLSLTQQDEPLHRCAADILFQENYRPGSVADAPTPLQKESFYNRQPMCSLP
jgi:hypothetical protein